MSGMYGYVDINVHVFVSEIPFPPLGSGAGARHACIKSSGVVGWHTSKQAGLALGPLMGGGLGTMGDKTGFPRDSHYILLCHSMQQAFGKLMPKIFLHPLRISLLCIVVQYLMAIQISM